MRQGRTTFQNLKFLMVFWHQSIRIGEGIDLNISIVEILRGFFRNFKYLINGTFLDIFVWLYMSSYICAACERVSTARQRMPMTHERGRPSSG